MSMHDFDTGPLKDTYGNGITIVADEVGIAITTQTTMSGSELWTGVILESPEHAALVINRLQQLRNETWPDPMDS